MTSEEAERRFRALFDRCYRPVLGYALRRAATRSGAEDVAADTFLVAWRRIGDVPREDSEALAWLLGVARRILSNARRGDARRDRLIARLHQHRSDAGVDLDAEAVAMVNERHATVLAVLATLRAADAEILQLATWEQLSHAQIAVVLDCSVNAVAIRLHRARRAFTDALAKDDRESGHFGVMDRDVERPPREP